MHTLNIEFFLGSESTKPVTSKRSHIALLCFPYCTYSKTRITNMCWNWFTAWRVLYTYTYYFKLTSLRNVQGSPYFPLIPHFFTTLPSNMLALGTHLDNLCIMRQSDTLVKSRTLELEYLHPPSTSCLTLSQASMLLCASSMKWRQKPYLTHENVLKIKWVHACKALRKVPGTLKSYISIMLLLFLLLALLSSPIQLP